MIKTTIATPNDSNEFRLKECLFKVNKDRDGNYKILYVKGILYPSEYKTNFKEISW